MEDIKMILDVGISGTISLILIILAIKFLPQYIEIRLKRMKDKDYLIDSFKSVISLNNNVVENNTETIKNNSTIIKNYTDNAHKLETKLDSLADEVRESNKLMTEANIILKERK